MSTMQSLRTWLTSDMRTLRWVLLGLYLALVAGLSFPFFTDSDSLTLWYFLLGGVVGGQALFIFGGGTMQLCRPIRKARLWMPVLVAAIMAGILLSGAVLALYELVMADDELPEPWNYLLLWFLAGNWMLWAPLFWVYTQRKKRHDALARLASWLFAGSLAELLACVPAHIITSRRSYCLAGLLTMLGILAGVYVMLFSFGPALALLFLRPRFRREQMEDPPLCAACGYDLRGTLEAGRQACPECGHGLAA